MLFCRADQEFTNRVQLINASMWHGVRTGLGHQQGGVLTSQAGTSKGSQAGCGETTPCSGSTMCKSKKKSSPDCSNYFNGLKQDVIGYIRQHYPERTIESRLPNSGDVLFSLTNRDNTIASCLGASATVCCAVDHAWHHQKQGRATRSFCVVRPPGHHSCQKERPYGFCAINNVVMGIHHAATLGCYRRVAVLDFDLHYGDGTAKFSESINSRQSRGRLRVDNLDRMFYASVHMSNEFPPCVLEGSGVPDSMSCKCVKAANSKNCYDCSVSNVHRHNAPVSSLGAAFPQSFAKFCSELKAFSPDLVFISAGKLSAELCCNQFADTSHSLFYA